MTYIRTKNIEDLEHLGINMFVTLLSFSNLFCAVGVAGNMLVLTAILKEKEMRTARWPIRMSTSTSPAAESSSS